MGNMRTRLPTPPCGQHVIFKLQEDFNIEDVYLKETSVLDQVYSRSTCLSPVSLQP